MFEDLCSCEKDIKEFNRAQRIYVQKAGSGDFARAVQARDRLEELEESLLDCNCDSFYSDVLYGAKLDREHIPIFAGGNIRRESEVLPGPKIGYRLVESSGGSIFYDRGNKNGIFPGKVEESPTGLYFFTGSINDPSFRDGLIFEAATVGDDRPDGAWLTRDLEFWEIRAYNWVHAPTGDLHEGTARKIVYVRNLTPWYRKTITSAFADHLGLDQEAKSIVSDIDFTGMDETIPGVVSEVLTGARGYSPKIIPEGKQYISEALKAIGQDAYTIGNSPLETYLYERSKGPLRRYLEERVRYDLDEE